MDFGPAVDARAGIDAPRVGRRPGNTGHVLVSCAKWTLVCVALAGASLGAFAQQAMTITSTAPLAFGKFAAGTGGTVTVSPGSARTASGAVMLSSSGAGSAASFALTGTRKQAVTIITLPANGTVALTGPGGASMAINNFTSNPSAATGGALSAAGTAILQVGATLTVGANQVPGAYAGTFSVTVNY